MRVSARLRRRMGLGAPASDQEWPPGPVRVTRKRREPRARVTTAEVAAAFEDDGGGDAVAVGAALEEVAHAAEVAFAFFAYVGGEEDGDGWGDVGVAEGGGYGEQAGESGDVVADAGGVDAVGVGGFDGFAVGAFGEDGVEVGGEEDDRER